MESLLARLLALLAMHALPASNVGAAPQPYVPAGGDCGGFPLAKIEMAEGYCAGIVFDPGSRGFRHRSIRTPRMLLELERDSWLISDLGAWTTGQGKVWLLDVSTPARPDARLLLDGLDLPHTLARGPDGKIYVGEMGRVFRFDAEATHPLSTVQSVVDDLPDNELHVGRHPLSHFAFDANHDLLVNVGAATDQCAGTPDVEPAGRCAEDGVRAVVRRYRYLGEGKWSQSFEIMAHGLRNSMVLLRHASGTLLQAENSYDFAPDSDYPHDEINVLRRGAHFGWPYCFDLADSTPIWSGSTALDCNGHGHARPHVLLPPHSAPLAAVYYAGPMFPQLQGKMLMSLHGYRPTGSRIVSIDVDDAGLPLVSKDPDGRPVPAFADLTTGWQLEAGSRPQGAPVGIAVAADGSIWVADDRNAAILRISRKPR